MKRFLLAASLLLLIPMSAQAIGGLEDPQLDARPARVIRANDGSALTGPSSAPHAKIVAGFLKSQGRTEKAVTGIVEVSANQVPRTGITHHRMEQVVDGFPVFGAYSKVAIDAEGRVVSAIDKLVNPEGGVLRARIGESRAVELAIENLYGASRPDFHQAPTALRVAVPMNDGTLREGFVVETWSEKTNQLHHTLVSGMGRILNVELRTASDSYNVFTKNPSDTPQTIINGPGSGNTESPTGWLYVTGQKPMDISGNNAHAYLDTDANNAPDSTSGSVTNGNFITAANLNEQPSSSTNKAVAVQNLFYLNNVIHDKLYRHGFTEAAGNFQEDNGGLGGFGSDSVNAEAQDGSGTDNANFSTPSDGSNPRMQMFLFNGIGDHLVTVGSSSYLAMGAEFGPALTTTGVSGNIAYAGDGCTTIQTSLSNLIAVIDRGTCAFVDKVGNAQAAGAKGVIVVNNAGDGILAMGGTSSSITIPSVFVGQSSGAAILSANAVTKISANPTAPLMRDGDVDSDIVFHEYGHGLTWRMIGSMSGAMSGAIGEGASDVLSILMNDHDVVGTYVVSNSTGIRRYPYTNYPITYGGFTGAEVHDDGEIYAAAVWRVWQVFQAHGVSKDTLWDYVVDGMNYTPAGPAMEDMRDGILAAAAGNATHQCYVWEGFAGQGIGQGAQATVKGRSITVTESFTVPSSCSGTPTNNPPTAAFSSSVNGLTASFTDSSSDSDGSIASRSWSFGDGGTSTSTNPSHTYAAAGTYTVTLTVTDNGGATDSTSGSVTVTAPTGISLSAVGYKVKGLQRADLNWSGATNPVTVKRNGATIATVSGSSYTDNIGKKGAGSYTYQVCDAGGCSNTVQVNF